jgi:hypothetical protein
MLRLPSGHIVGIMHERARFHARRLNRHITPYTPASQLHALVDIVFADAKDSPEMWRKNYVFSGHTLADRDWLKLWTAHDRESFLNWLGETPQRQEIEAARRRVLADNKPLQLVHFPYPEQLYSLLLRRIESLALNAASVEQWRNTITNLAKQGIRREEIQWSGVMAFLDDAERIGHHTVRKTELLEHIGFDNIRMDLVNELEYDQDATLRFVEKARVYTNAQLHCAGIWVADSDIGIVRYINPSNGYRVGLVRPRRKRFPGADLNRWFALGPFMDALPDERDGSVFYASAEQAMAAATAHARQSKRLLPRLRLRDRYEYMSLAGGEDYREWLLTLPDYQRSHFTAHYLERNVLLHMRTKVHSDTAGRRLLLIDEIQSDWHQAAARHGYDHWSSPIPAAPFRKEWVELALKLQLLHASEQGYDGLAWTDGATQQLRYGRAMEPVRRIYDQTIPHCLERLGRPWSAIVTETRVQTRRPNLMAARHRQHWEVRDHDGKLHTRPRYTKEQALELIRRHSRAIELDVPMFLIPGQMREHLLEHGAPLFGLQF